MRSIFIPREPFTSTTSSGRTRACTRRTASAGSSLYSMCAAGNPASSAPSRGRGRGSRSKPAARVRPPPRTGPRHDADPTPWDRAPACLRAPRWPFLFPSPDASASRARPWCCSGWRCSSRRSGARRWAGGRGACGDRAWWRWRAPHDAVRIEAERDSDGGRGDRVVAVVGTDQLQLHPVPRAAEFQLHPQPGAAVVGRDQPDVLPCVAPKVTSRRRESFACAITRGSSCSPPPHRRGAARGTARLSRARRRPRTRLPRGAPAHVGDDGHVRVRPLREPRDLARWFMPHSMAA